MLRKKFLVTLFIIVATIIIGISPTASAQLPFIQDLAIYSRFIRQVQADSLNSACIRLDGRCLFKLAATDSELLSDRINEVQKRFGEVTTEYLSNEDSPVKITIRKIGNLQDIYLVLDGQEERLFTVTTPDARANDVSVLIRAEQLKLQIEQGLQVAKQERSPQYLRKQLIFGLCSLILILLVNFPLTWWIRQLRRSTKGLAPSIASKTLPIADQLARRQKWNLTEVKYRLLQLVQVLLWGGGFLFLLNLWPQTRIIPFLLIAALRIPFRVGIVALMTYILIRLTFFLIAKLSAVAIESQPDDLRVNQRGKLRINTTTRILRSSVTIIWTGIGVLFGFWVNGVNIAPILAGAGIFGLGLSLASQNLIKDAINGFIIIWDDRYAVGDIVDIGTVSGLVENINLRITQLRDAEGRLITVPNSAVDIVANRSSQWSRADLNIPVAYQTDIDRALNLIHQVAEAISEDPDWQERIWEFPNILGVDNFSDRGILIRVWIKTEPLKQWEVAREFRRRVKIAFDQAGIPISAPQQQILLEKNFASKKEQN
ncbi:mechanosensitive ion channel family protein [Pleurocapsa sp. PCC 7319]|uniref:mechanosensitive ion channel family protein n=1 Tax=Pleurocapsa sp. PCC 7319 TaxID=118161 RepID=UPI000345DF65|nr:mechanosensitive ion channel family protein [Pleurocapsa sp. PCC 7319]